MIRPSRNGSDLGPVGTPYPSACILTDMGQGLRYPVRVGPHNPKGLSLGNIPTRTDTKDPAVGQDPGDPGSRPQRVGSEVVQIMTPRVRSVTLNAVQ